MFYVSRLFVKDKKYTSFNIYSIFSLKIFLKVESEFRIGKRRIKVAARKGRNVKNSKIFEKNFSNRRQA